MSADRIREVFRQACLYSHAADDLLCQRLAEAVKPQAEPVAMDAWVDHCRFEVTFDGETVHPLMLGGHYADKHGIKRMTFVCAAPPRPQGSAEDVALVDGVIQRHVEWHAPIGVAQAWQRIRASLGVGK